MPTPLTRKLEASLKQGGLTVADYMAACLTDPEFGYYTTRDPLGAAGDFTTSPEISQIFGELIGLWVASAWLKSGSPDATLLELGPGRGTLMRDAWRALRSIPGAHDALHVEFLEASRPLRDAQAKTLSPLRPTWRDDLGALPSRPLFVIANEFFDALPVRQLIFEGGQWRERAVRMMGDDALAFATGDAVDFTPPLSTPIEGGIYEWQEASATVAARLAGHIARHGGAFLAIDYGHAGPIEGDTLQAMQAHGYADPLAEPGMADLTCHVDFTQLAEAGVAAGLMAHGPVTQRQFLRALGIELRLARLMTKAVPSAARTLAEGAERLIDAHSIKSMGLLFKVLALAPAALGPLDGFTAQP